MHVLVSETDSPGRIIGIAKKGDELSVLNPGDEAAQILPRVPICRTRRIDVVRLCSTLSGHRTISNEIIGQSFRLHHVDRSGSCMNDIAFCQVADYAAIPATNAKDFAISTSKLVG